MDLTPDGTRLLVVNLPDNRLEILNLGPGGPTRGVSIPVGLDPVSVRARTNHEAWVVNHVSDTVSVVNLTTRNVVATLPTDDEPADVVFAGSPQRAFVSCSQANTLLVFDPADLTLAPTRVPIAGEDPRALEVSPSGHQVYVAVFESGNDTTILGGGAVANVGFPPNVVNDAAGPYAGVNPPPNDGTNFDPPIKTGLPTPPAVGLIVRRDSSGNWLDDNNGDWTNLVSGAMASKSGRPVGWKLLDHDLAIVNAQTLAVTYADRLMNLCMATGVDPATGKVAVVGTDAINEIRFEPNLNGRFIRVRLALVDPAQPASPTLVDLNTHLAYTGATVAQSMRDETISDPRGIVWNQAGTRAYVTGMGTNNLVVLDATGARAGLASTVEVGEGPTGIVLDEARKRLYVLNKFESTVSVVNTTTELEIDRVALHDPSPPEIRKGRRHLYDAHETSGLGLTSCAACHVDARMDRLSWDLGDPQGDVKSTAGQNLGGNVPGLTAGFADWHPMKGPMLTQTLQDIIGKEPHHWRGDRNGIEEFNGAFQSLLGDDESLTTGEMREFEDFLATIRFPPNPFRDRSNALPINLALAGHFEPGLFGTAGTALPNGDASAGLALYRPPRLLDSNGLACVTCHTLPTGLGTDNQLVNLTTFVPIDPGPNGERHHALVSIDGSTNVTMKVPHLRNLYERTGFDLTQTDNTAGFGYLHDGSVDSIARFLTEPVFTLASQGELADLLAFMLAFSGSDLPQGSPTALLEPPGTASLDTHAAVGWQVTVTDGANAAQPTLDSIDAMIALADAGDVGLVVKGRRSKEHRGWYHRWGQVFQSDRKKGRHTLDQLLAGARRWNELTFTVVPAGSEVRVGVDRDEDGIFDRDELDGRSDPADPTSKPKVRQVPSGQRL
jgi:YVTN family beta-propeller protein